MKKICGLLVVFCLLTAAISVQTFAYTDVTGYEVTSAVELLRAMDIMYGYEGNVFKPDDPVTRAEFAVTAARMICAAETGAGGSSYYSDIPEMHFARGAIDNLTKIGVISGDGQGEFRPDEPVKTAEAYKMLLIILGYGKYLPYRGGYPSACAQLANEADIAVGVPLEQNLTRGQVALMAAKALEAPMMVVTEVLTDDVTLKPDKEITLLSRYRGIYKTEGLVTAVPGTSLLSEKTYRENEISVDGVRYEYVSDGIADLIGSTVEVYYTQDAAKEDRKAVFLQETEQADRQLVISAENIVSFNPDSYVLTYNEPGGAKTKTARLDRGISVVKNRVAAADVTPDDFLIEHGTLRLKQSKNSDNYDVAIILDYQTFVIGTVDAVTEKAYDYYDKSSIIDLNPENVRLINPAGKEVSLADLKQKDVLSLFEGSKTYSEAYVADAPLQGILEEISVADATQYLIDGRYYDVDAAFLKRSRLEPSVGSTVEFVLDAFGKIAYFETVSAEQFGYAVRASAESLEKPRLKLFSQDGSMKIYDLADNIKINGSVKKAGEVVSKYLCDYAGNPVSQLVLFSLNSGGQICSLQTVRQTDEPGSLRISKAERERNWKINGYFAEDIFIDAKTLLFSVPEDTSNADDDLYQMIEKGSLSEATAMRYKTTAYTTKDKVGYEQVVVIKSDEDTVVSAVDAYCMVDKMTREINDEGTAVDCLYAYQGRTLNKWYAKSGYSLPQDICTGDIVKPAINMKGEVVDVELIYDCDSGQRPTFVTETANFHDHYRIMFGYATDLVDPVFKLSFYPDGEESFLYDITKTVVIVYDSSQPEGKQVYCGTMNDLELYSYVEGNCTRLLLQSYYEAAKIIYAYR